MFCKTNNANAGNLKNEIKDVLKRSGIKKGDAILDFGCGSGIYAIPAAEIVGNTGTVFVLDSDNTKLNELKKKSKERSLDNIVEIDAKDNNKICIKDDSVNAVLAFDVLHSYYFPSIESRRDILCDFQRVLLPGALLLVHPTHIDHAEILDEIERVGFQFHDKYSGNLIHNGKCEWSTILVFRAHRKTHL
jgi:ubiquinone/menaquinone biosynthesis C-methylase UbiE